MKQVKIYKTCYISGKAYKAGEVAFVDDLTFAQIKKQRAGLLIGESKEEKPTKRKKNA